MSGQDLVIVHCMLYALLFICVAFIGVVIYCGFGSGPNPRIRLPDYIVADLRKRGHLPKGYR